mgnify:CR=1 FL=1
MKRVITKYMLFNNTARYLDKLQELVSSVNKTYNRSLGTTPKIAWESRGDDFARIFMHQYFDPKRFQKKKKAPTSNRKLTKAKIKRKMDRSQKNVYHFKMSDLVRIELSGDNDKLTHPGYKITFSNETFNIYSRRMINGTDYYVLKDSKNNVLKTSFIFTQLQKVTQEDSPLYKIEKVVKTKKIRGVKWCYIKWLNFSSKENSWIRQEDMVDI